MRTEVESILLARGHCYFDLPLAARLLLVTDGTVTELLEAMLREPLELGHKNQMLDKVENYSQVLHGGGTTDCLYRAITLRGSRTNVDWLYAESIVFHQLLSQTAQNMLIEDKIPIGAILKDQTSDNHRKIVDCGIEPCQSAAIHLKLSPEYRFVYRNYHIVVGFNPIMSITEWFPIDRINQEILDVASGRITQD